MKITGIAHLYLLLGVCCFNVNAKPLIDWYDWQPEAFKAARDENKLIMVNVGHEGCTACRYMENNTFTNPAVVALLNENFINIQVDSEARPDLGERYSDWAWPATAFMRPDGTQVTALRGSRGPKKFIPILEDLIARHAAGELKDDKREPYAAPQTQNDGPLVDIRSRIRGQLERGYNDETGGWGRAKVLEYAEPTLQFLMRGYMYNDELAAERGLKNARGFTKQFDTVWGGVFYASINSWDNSVKEKRTESQAAGLQLFASAYQLSGDEIFRERLSQIASYLNNHMRSPNGLYYASQKDIVPGMSGIDIETYYSLSDSERRKHGIPSTDHSLFTDLNARIVEGLVRAFEATNEQHFLDAATATAETLTRERKTPSGWYLQLKPAAELANDNRVHVLRFDERPYLRTQAYMGRALIALYQASAERRWLGHALDVAGAMRELLEDRARGGFFAAQADGTETTIARRKPLEDNAVAAQFLFLLGVAAKQDDLKLVAEKSLRATALPEIMRREGKVTGNLAVALEMLSAGYVEFSVVGNRGDGQAQQLLSAAQSVYEPRKLVHFEAPGRYPVQERAAMYICNDDACSLPIYDAKLVSIEAKKFTPIAFTGVGGGLRRLKPDS